MRNIYYNNEKSLLQNELNETDETLFEVDPNCIFTQYNGKLPMPGGIEIISAYELKDSFIIRSFDQISKRFFISDDYDIVEVLNDIIRKTFMARHDYYESFLRKFHYIITTL